MNNILLPAMSEVIERSSLERKLSSGKKLRIKLGVDPSAPDLHLGHYIVLKQLCQFKKAGHKIIFLIGDFTAQIGDPSGRKTERPVLSAEQIKNNVKTYLDQVSLAININDIEIRYNSEWYSKMNLGEWLKILQKFSVNYIFERDDFSKRIKEGLSLGMHETMYPIMQAYDSVQLKADVEIGGTDQKFNILAGRALQRKMDLPMQDVVIMKLLVGTDGEKKMSKSIGNYIGLTFSAEDMFGKVMSIPDSAMADYAKLVLQKSIADIEKEIGNDHPMAVKKQIAYEIVEIFHPGSGDSAKASFERIFSKKKEPENIKVVSVGAHREVLKDILIEAGLVSSVSELMRLVEQGAVKMNERLIKPEDIRSSIPKGEHSIKIGSRRFIKIINRYGKSKSS